MSPLVLVGALALAPTPTDDVEVVGPMPEAESSSPDDGVSTDDAETEVLDDAEAASDAEAPGDAEAASDVEAPDDAEALDDAEMTSDAAEERSADGSSASSSSPFEPSATAASDIDLSQGLGGYHRPGEILEREPPDGHRNIVIGSILVPLGTLATVTSAVGTWLTVPEHCTERLAGVGITIDDPSSCNGVFAFNVVRSTYGALMLASGAVILSIGLVQRQRYRAWRLEHGMRARVAPTLAPSRHGALGGLRIRF